jgi:hypothetical protein
MEWTMNSYNECKAIVELDLDPIKVKLMHKESGEGWTLEQASAVENEYRRYLYLMKIFPSEMAAPSMDVDTFWHYHILDTMKYVRDCEDVFGYFLHHFPYVGLRGQDDLAAHEEMGERMAVLYEQTFGQKYPDSLISDAASAANDMTAYSSRPAAMTAYSSRPTATIAYSSRPTATAAYSSRPAAMTAYSSRPTAATAYSSRPAVTATAPHSGLNQDETESATHLGRPAYLSAETVATDDVVMNKFFLTRPQLPVQANAN